MAKRFTDSRKWDDGWFLSLDPMWKLTWLYLLDKCDQAGIYKHAPTLEQCCLGINLDPNVMAEVFTNRIVIVDEEKWFIPKFIEFQYGAKEGWIPRNNCEKSAALKIESLGKGCSRVKEPLLKGVGLGLGLGLGNINNNPDTDKDNCSSVHDKDKKIGDKFNEFWDAYPRKVGMSMAFKTFSATIKTDKDFQDLMTALKNYMASKDVKGGYIKNGDNWLEDWRGWINVKTEIRWKKP